MLNNEAAKVRDKRRRKALAWWTLLVLVWGFFAYKESKHEPALPMADSSTKAMTIQHLHTESTDPLLVIPGGRE